MGQTAAWEKEHNLVLEHSAGKENQTCLSLYGRYIPYVKGLRLRDVVSWEI